MLVLSGAIEGNGPFTVLPCDGETDIRTYIERAVGHVKKLEGEEDEEEQEDEELQPGEQEDEKEFILEVSFCP